MSKRRKCRTVTLLRCWSYMMNTTTELSEGTDKSIQIHWGPVKTPNNSWAV